MTSCTKPIWIITFINDDKQRRTQRIAAYDFLQAIEYFNERGQKQIVEVKKTDEEITYHY